MIKEVVALILGVFAVLALPAQIAIQLWPEGSMPNSRGLDIPDSTDKEFLFLTTKPKMYAYLANKENNTGAAILVVPGGGYLRLPKDYSQVATALYYQSQGVNAFVLSHRLPASLDLVNPELAPLQDAQRAMRMIYASAAQWGIDSARIGVGGTSAGGHVASTLGTHLDDVSAIGDSLDNYSYRPKFMVLVSPVISFDTSIAHKGSRDRLLRSSMTAESIRAYSNENRVTKDTPPTILIHGDNDKTVPALNSVVFYQALKRAGITSSLHIFPYGGHGYTVKENPGSANMWPSIVMAWLKEMKFVN